MGLRQGEMKVSTLPIMPFEASVRELALGVSMAREVLVLTAGEGGGIAAVLPWSEFARLKRMAGESL
jgi:hypothetical protein